MKNRSNSIFPLLLIHSYPQIYWVKTTPLAVGQDGARTKNGNWIIHPGWEIRAASVLDIEKDLYSRIDENAIASFDVSQTWLWIDKHCLSSETLWYDSKEDAATAIADALEKDPLIK